MSDDGWILQEKGFLLMSLLFKTNDNVMTHHTTPKNAVFDRNKYLTGRNSVSFGGNLAAVASSERSALPLEQRYLRCVPRLPNYLAKDNFLWQNTAQRLSSGN